MSYFPIARANKWRYTPAAPQGVSRKRYLKTEQIAASNWQLARKTNAKASPAEEYLA
jgi:hypothetical protein